MNDSSSMIRVGRVNSSSPSNDDEEGEFSWTHEDSLMTNHLSLTGEDTTSQSSRACRNCKISYADITEHELDTTMLEEQTDTYQKKKRRTE